MMQPVRLGCDRAEIWEEASARAKWLPESDFE